MFCFRFVSLSHGLWHPKVHVRFELARIVGIGIVAAVAAAAVLAVGIPEEPAVEKVVCHRLDRPTVGRAVA